MHSACAQNASVAACRMRPQHAIATLSLHRLHETIGALTMSCRLGRVVKEVGIVPVKLLFCAQDCTRHMPGVSSGHMHAGQERAHVRTTIADLVRSNLSNLLVPGSLLHMAFVRIWIPPPLIFTRRLPAASGRLPATAHGFPHAPRV